MRILYGVVGEGMGHATRSRVVLEHLLSSGHEIQVMVSGRAHRLLKKAFKNRIGISIEEIHGLSLVIDEGEIDKSETLKENLEALPQGLKHNLSLVKKVADGFNPEAVISDFESWAFFYGRAHGLPVISIDNMQVLNRCAHDDDVTLSKAKGFRIAKLAVKAKLPGAYHYLVTSFFFPRVRKKNTTLVPPILRDNVLAAKRVRGNHVLVYQTAGTSTELVPLLQRFPDVEFRVYGFERDGVEKNVEHRPFSEIGFINDLRTARAVVANGGFSLMGEAVYVGVPMLSLPIAGQFEQTLNALYLDKEGYGRFAEVLDDEVLKEFLDDTDRYELALEKFPREENSILFGCLDELLRDICILEPAKNELSAENLGSYDPYPLDDETDN
ncbi:MAG: teichoic acid biosynthesis protein [Deltaproteobacteria bacterium]|nr:teichoic acid biosynthesis protein [Deltaproteobacteria bacterium]